MDIYSKTYNFVFDEFVALGEFFRFFYNNDINMNFVIV